MLINYTHDEKAKNTIKHGKNDIFLTPLCNKLSIIQLLYRAVQLLFVACSQLFLQITGWRKERVNYYIVCGF